MNRRALVLWAVMVVAALAAACGGGGPSSPSASSGSVVKGTVLGSGGTLHASTNTGAVAAGAGKTTVSVLGTTITAEVQPNGTFELKGILSGTFTLVVTVDGKEIGRFVVEAEPGSEIKVVLEIKDSKLTVVEIKVEGTVSPSPSPSASPTSSCIVEGGRVNQGIELEGNVSSAKPASDKGFAMTAAGVKGGVVDVDATGASYRCIGGAKTPTDAECRASLKAGVKLHVRGTLTACTLTSANVNASEVKIQKD